MEGKPKFQRTFLIFNQEDRGYGAGQEPSGHVRIEVGGSKGKLFASVQNLKEEQDKFIYKLYLLKCSENKNSAVCAGPIPVNRNKGELNWEFDPDNVGMSGGSIEEFKVAAVLVEFLDGRDAGVVCPLAAYRGGRIAWRSVLKDTAQPVGARHKEAKEGVAGKDSDFIKYASQIESKYIPAEDDPKLNIPELCREKFDPDRIINGTSGIVPDETFTEEEKVPEALEVASSETLEHNGPDGEEADRISIEELQVEDKQEEEPGGIPIQEPQAEDKGEEEPGGIPIEELQVEAKGEEESGRDFAEENHVENKVEKESVRSSGGELQVEDKREDGSFCAAQANSQNLNPCAGCQMCTTGRAAGKVDKENVDIRKLVEEFDRFFQRDDPFHSRRRDYRWWKVNSPVYLNNILYQFNIRNPILFNPSVMMAHFKYRHLIAGIYIDKMRKREYIVYGVPGVYNVDERPFGELCRWVQMEGNRPRYGAFGYWLVYIEPKTGRILSFS